MNVNLLESDKNQPLTEGSGEIRDIGILNLYDRAIKYTINHIGIYANGNLFCSTFNDNSTSEAVFIKTMKAAFGDRFSSLMGYGCSEVDFARNIHSCGGRSDLVRLGKLFEKVFSVAAIMIDSAGDYL
jgi:hypothetical protein